jgi:hypothetical protein
MGWQWVVVDDQPRGAGKLCLASDGDGGCGEAGVSAGGVGKDPRTLNLKDEELRPRYEQGPGGIEMRGRQSST